jgi:hypothetical protein
VAGYRWSNTDKIVGKFFLHYWSTFIYIIGAHFYTLLLAIGEAASLIAEDLLVALYCPPATSTVTVTAPAFHPVAPPAMTPLPSTLPMATTAPSSCGSNLAFRLGRSKVLCTFYFFISMRLEPTV